MNSRADIEADRLVLEHGRDIQALACPDWALESSTWTQVFGCTLAYIEADERTAAALYNARFDENPYGHGGYGNRNCDILEREACSLWRASAGTRNARLVSSPSYNWSDCLFDETRACIHTRPVVGVEQLLSDPAYVIIRAGEFSTDEITFDADELEDMVAEEWVQAARDADYF